MAPGLDGVGLLAVRRRALSCALAAATAVSVLGVQAGVACDCAGTAKLDVTETVLAKSKHLTATLLATVSGVNENVGHVTLKAAAVKHKKGH
jgi:hypothetical protein